MKIDKQRPLTMFCATAATTVLVAGLGSTLNAATVASAATTAALTKKTPTALVKKTTARTYTYTGPLTYMRWGPVQVTITVKGKHITNVTATAPAERDRSAFLDSQALPILRQEVLTAQSAAINQVSGATELSDAYDASLQGAIATAKQARTL